MKPATSPNPALNKVLALTRHWRTDIGRYFAMHVSAFLAELPKLLVAESELLPAHEQQNYLDIASMLRREKDQVHAGFGAAMTVAIEEFAHHAAHGVDNDTTNISLSLIDTEDIEVTVMVEGLAAKVSSPIYDVLNDVFLRIKQITPAVTEASHLPCHPKSLIQTMLDGFATLSLNSSQKVILARLFASMLDVQELGRIITKSLRDADIPAYDQSVKILTQAGSTQVKPKNSDEKLDALLDGLSKVNISKTQSNPAKPDGSTQPDTQHVAEDLQEIKHANTQVKQQKQHEDASRLLSQLGELKALRQKLSQMPVAPEAKNPMVAEQRLETSELSTLLNELQDQQPVVSVTQNNNIQSIGEIRNQIRNKLRSDNEVVQTLQNKDTDVINLMSLMFDYILDNPNLPTAMKALLARLQIPMLRVALQSPEFFSESNHPARKLLDDLAKAGIGWDKASQKDSYYDKLEGIVFRILKEFRDDIAIFSKLHNELRDYLNQKGQAVERTEARVKDKESKKAQTLTSQKFVQRQINIRLVGKQLPLPVVKVLQNGWWHVIYHTYIRHGDQSSQFQSAVKVMDALIWSVSKPDANSAEWLGQVAHVRDKLMSNLKKGLTQVNFDEREQAKLLGEIDTIHDQLLHEKRVEHIQIKQETDSSLTLSELKVFEDAEVAEVALPKDVVDDEPEANQEELTTDMMQQVINMPTGTWVEFDVNTDSPKRRKLVAIIRALNKMIFTNHRGIKVAEIRLATMARLLSSGEAHIIEDESVISSAIGSVIEHAN